MLPPTALSWGIIAKSYKHGMVLRDISCYLFRVRDFWTMLGLIKGLHTMLNS